MSFTGTLMVEAGPRVNLIAGPNGSGKSSLVTAICVGLAGHMKNLGRQTHPLQLIRRGCRAFEVEVTLSGGPGQPDVVVHRRTEVAGGAGGRPSKRRRGEGGEDAGGAAGGGADDEGDGDGDVEERCQTSWRIDGQEVPQKRVAELTKSLGIHLDNLCQYLPQERVQEFSNLTASQLLESTEEVIGDGSLLRQHNALKDKSKQLKARREELAALQRRLERLEADQAAAKPEYERLQRRNALRRQVERMRLKLIWLEKEAAVARSARARQQVARTERDVKAAQQAVAKAEQPINARKDAQREAQQALGRLSRQARAKEDAAAAAQAELGQLEEALRDKEDKLDGLSARSRKWREEVGVLREALQQLRAELASLPRRPPPELLQQLEAVQERLQMAEAEAGEADAQASQKREDIRQTEVRIQQLENTLARRNDRREQLLRKLDQRAPGSRALHEWVSATRGAGGFRGRVYGPVLMEMSEVADPQWAAHLEHILGVGSLGAVITEDIRDNNDIQDWQRAQQARMGAHGGRQGRGAFTNSIVNVGNPAAPLTHPAGEPGPELQRRYGVSHTLDQLFEAPPLVKLALSNVRGINRTYVGNSQTDTSQVMNALVRETPIRRVMTPGKCTIVTTSYYDPGVSYQKIEDVKPARLLAVGMEAGDGETEQQQLEQLQQAKEAAVSDLRQLEQAQRQRAAAAAALRAERGRLVAERNRIMNRPAELQRKEADQERRLQRLVRAGDPAAEAARLRAAARDDADKMAKRAHHMLRLLQEQHGLHRRLAAEQLAIEAAAAALQPLQAALERARGTLRASQAALADAQQRAQEEERKAAEAAAAAREAMGGRDEPSDELRAAWEEWPDGVEELGALLEEKQAESERAQAAMRGDEAQVLEAWERREQELGEQRKRAAAERVAVDALAADVEARKAAWLPGLKEHIATISESVASHFAAIGCSGEVALREAGDAFEDYAAEIRVSYRPGEPLLPLNRNRHSGGERTVATMLYIMALQGVTVTPFRVVDEINQGMDSRNERKVFNQLVECSSRPDTPQCFLITPKIVANLCYNSHVRVINLAPCTAGAIGDGRDLGARMLQLAAEVAASRAEADGDGAGGGGRGRSGRPAGQSRRPQQQQRHGGERPRLGQVPWELVKDVVFFGRRRAGA